MTSFRIRRPTTGQSKCRSSDTHRFKERAMRNMAGVTVEVIQNMVTGVMTVNADASIAHDFEAPRLCVISTGRPLGQFQDLMKAFYKHLFTLP